MKSSPPKLPPTKQTSLEVAKKARRGRRLTYKPDDRQMLAELVRLHGARGAVRASPFPITHHTILKIASEFGIPLKRGRRKVG